jgi:hypothetical protein
MTTTDPDLIITVPVRITYAPRPIDISDAADAARFRWILEGNGYFMEEEGLCGHGPCDQAEKNSARLEIDKYMNDNSYNKGVGQ